MRWIVLLSVGFLLASACRNSRTTAPKSAVEREPVWTNAENTATPDGGKSNGNAVIFPITSGDGTVAKVNKKLRFAVLEFPLHPMPAIGQQLFLYRRGQKVARIKVTGPVRGQTVVADIVEGNAEENDEVRAD